LFVCVRMSLILIQLSIEQWYFIKYNIHFRSSIKRIDYCYCLDNYIDISLSIIDYERIFIWGRTNVGETTTATCCDNWTSSTSTSSSTTTTFNWRRCRHGCRCQQYEWYVEEKNANTCTCTCMLFASFSIYSKLKTIETSVSLFCMRECFCYCCCCCCCCCCRRRSSSHMYVHMSWLQIYYNEIQRTFINRKKRERKRKEKKRRKKNERDDQLCLRHQS